MDAMAAVLHILTAIILAYVMLHKQLRETIASVVPVALLVAIAISTTLGCLSIVIDILGIRNAAVFTTWQVRQMSDSLVFALIALHIIRTAAGAKNA